MKILKLVLTIALLSSVAFADGEMGGGGLWGNDPSTTVVVTKSDEGEVNGNGTTTSEGEFDLDWLLKSVAELFGLNG